MRYSLSHTRKNTPLVVYQMGKVGSSSIVRSLEKVGLDMDIYQVHVLTKKWIDIVQEQYRKASHAYKHGIVGEHLLASMYLRSWMDKGYGPRRWKVVSLVRDPISRNISTFFQGFPIYFADVEKYYKKHNIKKEDRAPELIKIFFDSFEEHDTPLLWFDNHMQPGFDIDVFTSDFPKDKGYKIYHGEHADLLLLRLEDLEMCVSRAFMEFLDIKNFSLLDANISSNKAYSSAYSRFKNKVILPENYIDRMYQSKYMEHFYTPEEIARFREKWAGGK